MSHDYTKENEDRLARDGKRIKQIMVRECGRKCEHDWNGPVVEIENGESVTCTKCGAVMADEAMFW